MKGHKSFERHLGQKPLLVGEMAFRARERYVGAGTAALSPSCTGMEQNLMKCRQFAYWNFSNMQKHLKEIILCDSWLPKISRT